jgi:GNAT superfamily N-acetyltransferase
MNAEPTSAFTATQAHRASADEAGALSRLFAAAFLYDPIYQWIARPGPRRAAALERFFFRMLKTHAIPFGAAWIGEGAGAGAIWLAPNRPEAKSGLGEYFRLLFTFARLCGIKRLARGLAFDAAIARNRPQEPHYHLAFFAVAPRLQGLGMGSALLQNLLRPADENNLPVSLENSNPRNAAFYLRAGFEPRRNIAPLGAPPVTAMWRPARLR